MTSRASQAAVQVNKSFTPAIIQLGATSQVTITFENTNTTAAANITAFRDDIATMGGKAAIASPSGLTTTCPGGTPGIKGTVVTMNDGQIPKAPSSSVQGKCTIVFNVIGSAIGNGFNTIFAKDVATSLGSPPVDITQTLTIQPAILGLTNSPAVTTLTGTTASITFTISNPANLPLTNVSFPVNWNSAQTSSILSASSNCGATIPTAVVPPGTSGTLSFSGGTIPPNGTCVVTITATAGTVVTGNYTIPSGGIIDDQGATNTTGASTQIKWVVGNPNLGKSFSPTGISAGQTTTMTVTVQNVFSLITITNGAFNDTLPASLTLAPSPAPAFTNCTGTVGGFGSGTVNVSGLSIPPAVTCKITFTIQTPPTQPAGGVTNTIPQNAFTSSQVNGFAQAASASLSIAGGGGAGGFSATKAVSPNNAGPNAPITVTLKFSAFGGGTFTNGSFVDNLPQGLAPMAALSSPAPTFAGCGANPSLAFSNGNTTVTGSNLAIPTTNGTCTVTFPIAFTTPVSTPTIVTNSIPAPLVSFVDKNSNTQTTGTNSVNITENPAYSVTNYVASVQGLINQPLTVQASLNNTSQTPDTNATIGITLNAGKVALAAAPNFIFGPTCPPGLTADSVTIAPNRESFTIGPIPSINASCTISYNVIDENGVAGTFTPGKPTYQSTLTGGVVQQFTGTNNVTWNTTNLLVTKSFSPNQIQTGSVATALVQVGVQQAGTYPQTQASGVGFVDTLPANLFFTSTPNVQFSNGCVQSGQPAPAYAINGSSITVTNLSLLTIGGTPTYCMVSFNVTSPAVGAPLNVIPARSLTSTSGATNVQAAQASVTVGSGLGIQKTFLDSEVPSGGSSYIRLLITNTATASPIAGAQVTDPMPASLTLASTVLGPSLPGDPALCGGFITSAVGSSTFTIDGMTLPAGECVVYVLVRANAPKGALAVNTIPAGNLTGGGFINLNPATAQISITAAPNPNLVKTFSPGTIVPNGTSELTITIDNTEANAQALTAMALTDSLPAGVTLATVPNPRTTCGNGTVTGAPGGTSVALSGGSVAANAICTISVVVTASSPGAYINVIPPGALSTAQLATNATQVTGNLSVALPPNVNLSKSFSPQAIIPGGSSTLTIVLANTQPGSANLTGVGLTDTLPTGLTLATTPGASTTCGGSVAATGGGTSIVLSGASLAAGATCTISAKVTGLTTGTFTNTIPVGSLTSLQGASNDFPVSAPLTITTTPSVQVTKSFSPAAIDVNGVSALTLTIANIDGAAVPLTNLAVGDALPAGITVAPTPGASTTCPSGVVVAAAGSTNITLSGANLAVGSTCTVTANVTGSAPGAYVNTVPASAITSDQGVTNPVPVSATLSIAAASLSVVKSSNPQGAQVSPGQTIAYTIAVTNNGGGTETNAYLTDTLTNATLVSGSVQVNGAPAPDAVITSSQPFGSIASGATTTITYNATVNQNLAPGAQVTNNVVAGGTQPCAGPQCSAVSPPNVVAAPQVAVTKTINGQTETTVLQGQSVTYSMVVTNTEGGTASNVVLTDPVPAGLVPTPGTVTINGAAAPGATVSGQTVTVPIGTIAVGTTVTVAFQAVVAANAAGTYSNVATVTTSDTAETAVSNPAVANVLPPTIAVTKTASASLVQPGDRVDYSIVVSPLNGVAYGVTTVVDTLPNYETYAPGTARVNGAALEPSISGHVLTWTLPSLQAPATITYSVVIGVGAQPNSSLTNNVAVTAQGPGGSVGRGFASATVLVGGSTFGSCFPITGRVYLDIAGTGHYQDGDKGLGGVRVYLEDGEYVITDKDGRYNFPCVRPGMHALRLDESTLPPGSHAYADVDIDSERSTRRLVHRIFDTTLIEDINFAIAPDL
jgi:fimbrial isopeptide formation D2 family protein/uncharacterized repeat protein (TIGR01451 family)